MKVLAQASMLSVSKLLLSADGAGDDFKVSLLLNVR